MVFSSPPVELHVIRLFIPMALGFMALEYLISRLHDHDDETHDLAETGASLGVWAVQILVKALDSALVAIPFGFAYEHRLFDLPLVTPTSLAALFLATEFFYYWQHRASHRIRWFWATHSVHHSATRMNYTAAIRLGWTGGISGSLLFFLPLAWIGFHPVAIVGMLAVGLTYQFFIHTELVKGLGPLEWVLNTPTHHRVHHASNNACLDRNYGNVLIIFDRLFGTFAAPPADEPLRYGLVGGRRSLNPVRIALGEWGAILTDLRRARSLRDALTILFAPPGTPVPAASAPGQPPIASRDIDEPSLETIGD